MENIINSIIKAIIDSPDVSSITNGRVFHWQAPAKAKLPALTYHVADIRPVRFADNRVMAEEYIIVLDAFCRGSPKALATASATVMQSLGFIQEYWSDVPTEDDINQITMRFNKIYQTG